jgi:hypothetical protein
MHQGNVKCINDNICTTFRGTDILVTEEILMYDFGTIVGTVGGSMGLFLGLSCYQLAQRVLKGVCSYYHSTLDYYHWYRDIKCINDNPFAPHLSIEDDSKTKERKKQRLSFLSGIIRNAANFLNFIFVEILIRRHVFNTFGDILTNFAVATWVEFPQNFSPNPKTHYYSSSLAAKCQI